MEFSKILEGKGYTQRLSLIVAGKEEVFKSRIIKLEFTLESCELLSILKV